MLQEPSLLGSLLAFALTLTAFFHVLRVLSRRSSFSDKNGNTLPSGPRGLPIIGEFLLLLLHDSAKRD